MTIKNIGLIVGGYIVVALVMTWPVAATLNTRVAGTGGDPWQSMWRLTTTTETLQQVIKTGQLPALLTREFLGTGAARLVNLSAWPWVWLHAAFGEPTAYNLIWLASFIAAGLNMYLLVRWLTKNEAAAGVAGLYYMLLPYHTAHALGHFGALQIQWLPLIILIFLQWWQKPQWRRTLALGLLLTLQAWTEHHYTVWMAIFMGAYAIMHYREIPARIKSSIYIRHLVGLALLVIIGIVLPYRPTFKLATSSQSSLVLGEEQTIRFSADPFAYIVPSSLHTLWGKAVRPLYQSAFTGNIAEATQFLGFLPLLLIIFFRQAVPLSQQRLWLCIASLFLLLSLGPKLHVLGHVTGFPLPYALLNDWPILSSVRAIARAGVMVGLSVCVLFAWVLHTNIKRRINYVLIAFIICLEFLMLPFPGQSTATSPAYAALEKLPGQTVVELPAATNYVTASQALYGSTQHHKTVLGNIALERNGEDSAADALKLAPALRQLLLLRTTEIREQRLEFFGQSLVETLPDVLAWYQVGAILIHRDSLTDYQRTVIADWLEKQLGATPQHFADDTLYDVRTISAQGDGIFLQRGEGWEQIGFDRLRNHTFAQVLRRASVSIINRRQQSATISLSLTIAPESKSGSLALLQVAHPAQEVSVTPGERVHFRLTLAPGTSEIILHNRLPDTLIIQDPQLVSDHPQ